MKIIATRILICQRIQDEICMLAEYQIMNISQELKTVILSSIRIKLVDEYSPKRICCIITGNMEFPNKHKLIALQESKKQKNLIILIQK